MSDMDEFDKQERRRKQLRASKAKFRSDPVKRAAEIDKEKLRQRVERKKDSEKAFERRQVDSERKRQYLQTRECFSIWCSVCDKFFSNRLLSSTRHGIERWNTLSQRHIDMIKKMLDTRENPDCPQCLRSAEFFEDTQPVYTRIQHAVFMEAMDRKKGEKQAKAIDTTLASAIQPGRVDSPSRGDKWVFAISAIISAEKEKRSQQKQREDDENEKARREKWKISRCLYNNYDERRNYVIIENHSVGDHELLLNALGPGARAASEGFTRHKTDGNWWVPIANVAKWVTVNDKAINEDTMSDQFILDLVRNADRPTGGGIKFVASQ